jgi:uncharacterized PurR-regulated membrane protein YhhQ (DUF165 family)
VVRKHELSVSPYLLGVAALFVTCLITANITAVKLIAAGPFIVPAGIVIFPLSYLFGDVLTEVYGYAVTRRIIWLGFCCNLLAVAPPSGTTSAPTTASSARRRACSRPPSSPTWPASSATASSSPSSRS